MNVMKEGWFSEVSDLWPGQAMSLEVEEILAKEKSKYQDVLVCKTKHHGKALMLDGIIQVTEHDEFAYQEMMSHLPLNCHPNPEKVLIIGGGDGGVAREVTKHPAVKQVTMCEIDERVVELSKEHLPALSVGFDSPKLNLVIGDGFEFMGQHQGEFDVIITDSSDPIGPAHSLFEKSYFSLMKTALRPNGILASQGECLWLHLALIKEMQEFCRELFPVVSYASTSIPTYPSGQIGVLLCSTNPDTVFSDPVRTLTDVELDNLSLRYYNSDIHRASFVLPTFARKVLGAMK